jgi:hypothetical protein
MFKETKRKGFNFFRSYFDVYNELNKEDKVLFMDALLERQFLGIKPKSLKGMSSFAYISQTNSIDSQVKGYEDKTGDLLLHTPTAGATQGGKTTPTLQEEEKEEVQGEVKEKGKVKVEYTKIKEIFNSVCINLPKVKTITNKRKKNINARVKEYDLETIGNVFTKVSQSDFLNGNNSNGWTATFDWIFNPSNFIKILEDNYKNKEAQQLEPKIGRQTLSTIQQNAKGWD